MPPPIRPLVTLSPADVSQLADLTIDCVHHGASIGFMQPLTHQHASHFWLRVAKLVDQRRRLILVAEDSQGICGTVQIVLDLADNQPHRADIVKLQVHTRVRRQGLGEALMREAERHARAEGKTLLVLDTVTGSDAARLYERMGWIRVGEIPDYALFPDGSPCSTTYYYRKVR